MWMRSPLSQPVLLAGAGGGGAERNMVMAMVNITA